MSKTGPAAALALLLASFAFAQEEQPAPPPPDPLATRAFAESFVWEQAMNSTGTETEHYTGARFQAQAAMGHHALALRADASGLPGKFDRAKIETYRTIELALAWHWNMREAGRGVVCGPMVLADVALPMDGSQPSQPNPFTAAAGLICGKGSEYHAYAGPGMHQALPHLAFITAAQAKLAGNAYWFGDFAIDLKTGQQIVKVSLGVKLF